MPLPVRIRLARRNGGRGDGLPHEAAGRPAALSPDERLFALGARTLADLVAPAGAEVRRDHLQLDVQYLRVLMVTGYPRTVAAGWLAPLVEELDLPLEVSLHVQPLQSGDMVRLLGLKIAQLESSRRVQVRAERIADPERDIALQDAERLRAALQRGDERVFSASLYLLLRAPTRRALDELTRRVETQLDSLLTQSRVALFEQERGFRSCLPEGRDQLLVRRNLDTSSLAISLPLASSSLVMERGVLYGVGARLAPEEALKSETPLEELTGSDGGGVSHLLTSRELEVARLVARGLTNHQIAGALVISERTADKHVEHILNKLGSGTRVQIATWAVGQGAS